jgi:hypothetical protein
MIIIPPVLLLRERLYCVRFIHITDVHSWQFTFEKMQHLLYATFLVSTISAQYYTNLTKHAIIAATTITVAAGNTTIFGDVSISPGTAITGLIQNQNVVGTIHINDAQALQAKQSLSAAFDTLIVLPAGRNLTVTDLSTLILGPGVYNFSTPAISLVGNLTLTGAGLFVFQIGTTLITTQSSNIILLNGAVASQIYFLVGTSITIGGGSTINGMLLARQSITVDGARVYGGLYAQAAAVSITQPSTVTAVPQIPFTSGSSVETLTLFYASTSRRVDYFCYCLLVVITLSTRCLSC